MATTVSARAMATEGNRVASSFQKDDAVRCWKTTVEHCGLQDQELADAGGVTKSYFSKISSGQQGDLLGLIWQIGRQLPDVKRDFVARLAAAEGVDPLSIAAEQLAQASIRFLQLQGSDRPLRMAKAVVNNQKREAVS